MKQHASQRWGQQGFTVLELGIALGLMGVLAGASTMSISSYLGERELVGRSQALVGDLRSAQQLAIARRSTVLVTFTPRGGGIAAFYTVAVEGTMVRRQTLPMALDVTGTTVQFTSLGVPAGSSGAAVTLSHTTEEETRTVNVEPITGSVTVNDP